MTIIEKKLPNREQVEEIFTIATSLRIPNNTLEKIKLHGNEAGISANGMILLLIQLGLKLYTASEIKISHFENQE